MIAKNALFIADEIKADYILLFTNSWFLAKIVSAFKPNHKVFAFTRDEYVLNSLNILYAIEPFLIWKWWNYPLADEDTAISILKKKWLIKLWNKIVIINDVVDGNAISPYVKIVNI
jgi:pyruvate kinase